MNPLITITDAAARHIATMLQKEHKDGIRVGTKKSGCTGFSYVIDYAEEVKDTDIEFGTNGIRVIMDQSDVSRLQGMELDFQKTSLLNEGFVFNNPNVTNECGCGESFSTGK